MPVVTPQQKLRVFLKNPRTGTLLEGQCECDSLVEARSAAEKWKASQFLQHWHIVVKDGNGVTVVDDSPRERKKLSRPLVTYKNGRSVGAAKSA
jgi:hypothetical protein